MSDRGVEPRRRFEITLESLEAQSNKRIQDETDLSSTSLVHPFDQGEIQQFFTDEFPQLAESLKTAKRPRISAHPDEMENWEWARIRRRKQKQVFESPSAYVCRILYEEFFSVNQEPGSWPPVVFRGSAGYTPGGLISHHWPRVYPEGLKPVDVTNTPIRDSSVKDLLANTEISQDEKEKILLVALELTWPTQFGTNQYRPFDAYSLDSLVSGRRAEYPEDLDSVGFRMLRMFSFTPAMLEPLQDAELASLCGFSFQRLPSRAQFFTQLWRDAQALLTTSGTFRHLDETGVRAALEKLLRVRAHPEMQVFFEYCSPSGYCNEPMVPVSDNAPLDHSI